MYNVYKLFLHTVSVSDLLFMQPNLEGYEIHEVALKKKEGQSLGISIIGYNALTTEGKKHILPCFFPRNPTTNQFAVNYYLLASLVSVSCQMRWGSL